MKGCQNMRFKLIITKILKKIKKIKLEQWCETRETVKKVKFDGFVDWPMTYGLQQHVTEGRITCQRKKMLLFFLGKKVEEQCLKRRFFSYIIHFSQKQSRNLI